MTVRVLNSLALLAGVALPFVPACATQMSQTPPPGTYITQAPASGKLETEPTNSREKQTCAVEHSGCEHDDDCCSTFCALGRCEPRR
jgi:hypothetical protein